MSAVFVDALYYIALLLPRDDLHNPARRLGDSLAATQQVTSEPALTEVLAQLSGLGVRSRGIGVELIRGLQSDPFVEIVPQTHRLFEGRA